MATLRLLFALSGEIFNIKFINYFQLGGGYILSRQLAEFIANNRHLLKLYRSEDVSVGAWLAGLDVFYVHE